MASNDDINGEHGEDSTQSITEKENMYAEILKTSQYFTSVIELLPSKFYLNQEDPDENEDTKPGKRKKKKKPDDKKLLAKKAKLLKLDPSKIKTITELQTEVEAKEKEYFSTLPSEDEHLMPINVSTVVSNDSLEELREKLHAKMGSMRGNRKIPSAADNIKRKEKKENDTKKNKKIKESANIKRSNEVEKIAVNDDKDKDDKQDEGKIMFSKFDFAGKADKEVKKKGKDLKKLLDYAEKKQKKLKLLEETDVDEANKMKEKIVWDSVLRKAEGVKLKDNPVLLKKTLKRKDSEKKKSAKKWGERVETVDKNKKEKQEKRQKNIKERKEAQSSKAKGGTKKKKKSKPGF